MNAPRNDLRLPAKEMQDRPPSGDGSYDRRPSIFPNTSRDAQASGLNRTAHGDACYSSTRELALLGFYFAGYACGLPPSRKASGTCHPRRTKPAVTGGPCTLATSLKLQPPEGGTTNEGIRTRLTQSADSRQLLADRHRDHAGGTQGRSHYDAMRGIIDNTSD